MPAKEIIVRESAGLARLEEPVLVSVPFAKGELREPEGIGLLDPEGNPAPVQLQALSRWKDGSVQWLLCDFAASAAPEQELRYRLAPAAGPPAPLPSGIEVVPGDDSWSVDTGPARFLVDARTLRPFLGVAARHERPVAGPGECRLVLSDGTHPAPTVERVTLECPGPLRATLLLTGRFGTAPSVALFSCRLHFFALKSLCKVDFTLHNPRRARHSAGLWDLGDPGALFFRALSFGLPLEQPGEPLLLPAPLSRPVRSFGREFLSLVQHASGGTRGVTSQAPGYRLLAGSELLLEGDRATPVIWCGTGEVGAGAVLPRFWQEYPKAVAAGPKALLLSLFPETGEAHELQGGEQKRTSFWLDFSCHAAALATLRAPLAVLAAPEALRGCGVIPDLPEAQGDFLDLFLPGPAALLARREKIDEFGWRDFGDIYADHEAVYHRGEEPFVSHYNNQYDICAGLYRKFLATGDPSWGELAGDLARHVLDIDIYHTEEDREEYNGGLFWHTDHYISAGNATHRTFSAVHLPVKDPRFYGGGPAAEHCYTSGLLLHYHLTGDPDFRAAVIALADWCYLSLAGPPLLLATLKRCRGYLSQLRGCGGEKPLFPRYPLTRGTGNALTATLDAFQASGDRKYLSRAEELVRGALHPDDDLAARDLLNAEAAWSYTVLLGSVAKFLDKKAELDEYDAGYFFARDALLAYSSWMVQHEYPFLEKPEILEYPNETWAAQDLRKAVVLYHAARYAAEECRAPFLEKARRLISAARADLARFPTSSCTRPVALMLQNGWVAAALERELPPAPHRGSAAASYGPPTARLSLGAVALRVLGEVFRALRETGPKRELDWLKARLG